MLPDFVALLGTVVVLLASIALLLARPTRPASMSEAGAVLALSLLAGLGAFAFASLRDDAVEVRGETIYCENPEFEDDLPADVEDRCTAQRRDRAAQARLAALGAGVISAGGCCLLTAVGPLARRTDPGERLPLPPRHTAGDQRVP